MSAVRPPRAVVRTVEGLRTWESTLQRRGLGPVAGVDEAGRGACAGPLVVAACVLPPRPVPALDGLTDSKQLSEANRERLYPLVRRFALACSVVVVPPQEVDRFGIHVVNIEGMRRAVVGLGVVPGYVLLDGFGVPGLPCPSLPVIGGDAAVACIAAASVLAKVSRDRLMVHLHAQLPGYGFDAHKGYSTALHMSALRRLGPSREHRHSYANVRAVAGSVGAP